MNIIRTIYRVSKSMAETTLPPVCVRFLHMHKTGIKYLVSGGTAAVIDLGLLYIFTDIVGLWYLSSAVIAFVFGLLTSFLLHKFWTFRESSLHRMKKQFIFFTTLALGNLAINTYLMYIAVELLEIWYLFAQFVIMGGLALMNFVINKTITFKPEHIETKNILLATGIYPPDIGGPATYVKTLEEELPKHGFNVKVVTYSDEAEIQNSIRQLADKIQNKSQIQNHNELNIYRISRQQPKLLRYFKYFWQVLRLLSWADVVYVQGPVSEGLPVYWACKLRGRKYILKVVGDYAWEQMQVKSKKLKVKSTKFITLDEFQKQTFDVATERKRRIQKRVAKRAEKVIVPSTYLHGIVRRWGVDKNNIHIVYNSFESRVVEPKIKDHDHTWIVSVARLVPWKGMDVLISIMPELLAVKKNVTLIIIGDGPERHMLETEIKKLPLHQQNSVQLVGKLSHIETLSYIASADLFVLNSAYEGLSHVILESLSLGKPVYASSAGGNPELIVPGNNGELFEYNNRDEIQRKIIRFLNQGFLKGNLLRGRERIDFWQRFSKECMLQETIKILTS